MKKTKDESVRRGARLLHALPLLALLTSTPALALPSFDEVRASYRSSDTLVLDRHGELVQRVRSDLRVRRGPWLALEDVSPALRQALVLSEDRRFYSHSGVDWQAVSAAAWGNLWNQRTRGASTITMQLAGLLDDDWRAGSGGRNVVQKLGQTVAAQVLERRWRKDQILEAYLNLVPLRGELVGIAALSQSLFGKAASGLDQREAAVTAALVRAPNASAGALASRACQVQRLMASIALTAVDCPALQAFVAATLQRRNYDASAGIAPHLAQRLLAQARSADGQAPAVLRSTLDAGLQRLALQTLRQQLRELRQRQVEDGAVLVLDNASGEVLAWVGSSGDLSQAAAVDAVNAPRQAGSTLKPFLYARALTERRLTAASLLNDAPTEIATASGLYIPQNYDHQFKGWVSVRTALAASLNVPAVRTLEMVSPNAMVQQLAAAGLPLAQSGDYYGYSLALGSAEVTLLNLCNAYRTLANGGRYSPWRALLPNPRRPPPLTAALDPQAAFIVADILSDANARTRTFGVDSLLNTRFWSAVKTGTSKDMRDNWAVGFSQRYTVGVWVGNASGAAMHDVSGISGAAPVWATLMRHLHRTLPSRAPLPPPGLVQRPVRFGDALEAARQEWFVPGTAQALFAIDSEATTPANTPSTASNGLKEAGTARARILTPVDGTVLALDPDIPPAHQRLRLAADRADRRLRWTLDGRVLATGPEARWLPWPGRHRIVLLDADGVALDSAVIEVRGAAALKQAASR